MWTFFSIFFSKSDEMFVLVAYVPLDQANGCLLCV